MLSILTSLLTGGITIVTTWQATIPVSSARLSYGIGALLISVGVGLLVAWFASRRYAPALA